MQWGKNKEKQERQKDKEKEAYIKKDLITRNRALP
jgi:hypothetical protein